MSIIKLFLQAISTVSGNVGISTNVTVTPSVNRFSSTVVLGNVVGNTTTIPAQNFTNDTGIAVSPGGLITPTSNGYFNLFVNGVLQRGGISSLSSSSLVINTSIILGVTVIIEVINFTANVSSSTTNNISVDTTINY